MPYTDHVTLKGFPTLAILNYCENTEYYIWHGNKKKEIMKIGRNLGCGGFSGKNIYTGISPEKATTEGLCRAGLVLTFEQRFKALLGKLHSITKTWNI